MAEPTDDDSFAELELQEHFMGTLGGGKNRATATIFTIYMAAGKHAHLVGRGFSVCSLVEPCPSCLSYADWKRDYA